MQNLQDARLTALADEVERLRNRMESLEISLANSGLILPVAGTAPSPVPGDDPVAVAGSAEDLWTWFGRSSLLPQIAAVSFALVVALLLRTLTDAKIMAYQTGSYMGLLYAASLIGLGWRLFAGKRSALAPVLPGCGAILIFLVTLEAQARFAALSSLTAYIILLATLGTMVVLAGRYNSPFLGTLGLAGAGITGFIIDFPHPVFPLPALFFLIANAVAYLAANRAPHKETGRWAIFLLTLLFMLNWVVKSDSADHGPAWLLAFMILYQLAFSLMVILRTFVHGRLSVLDCLLPTVTGLLFYLALRSAIIPGPGDSALIGVIGVGWSALLFLAAFLAVYKSQATGKAACVFTFAGASLLLLTVPDITPTILFALPIWSAGALFLVRLSIHCEVGGIRLASYLLQVVASVAGVASGSFAVISGHLPFSLAVAGGLTLMSGYHYRASRRTPPVCSEGFFARIDPGDKSAVVLLLATVVNGFFALQLAAAIALAGLPVDFGPTLMGLRSVFINGGAILLLVLGLRENSREVLAVALAVFSVGALKVFVYDLFVLGGVPLLFSVFSFGAAAALGSVLLSRRQKAM